MISRTMLYLDAEQLELLKERARAERVPVTELVRRLIRQYLGQPIRGSASADSWARLVGLGASGQSEVSEQHDRALGDALSREHLR
jgi:Ribbon-helix-helix protein, copG family